MLSSDFTLDDSGCCFLVNVVDLLERKCNVYFLYIEHSTVGILVISTEARTPPLHPLRVSDYVKVKDPVLV